MAENWVSCSGRGGERQGLHGQLGARPGLAEERWLLEQLP